MKTNLTLSSACDRRLVANEVASQRLIEWIVTAPKITAPRSRAAINLALILDRSGSMQGDKLRYVQQAACHVLDQLDARDRVAVVAYDDQVTVIGRSEPMTEATRRDLKQRINALTPGGWTDLSGGWLEGCREIAAHQRDQEINRALLLTDGLANRGMTDIEELGHHARELRRRGIATSTFGVGLDFNEHLLEAMAEHGGGHFYYIERPERIPEVFRNELGELLTTIARETCLNLAIPRGLALELLGDLAHERTSDRLRIFLGDICTGERRTFYVRVLTPPDTVGTTIVLHGELGYANLSGHIERATAESTLTYAHESDIILVPLNEDILRRASEVELATAAARALKLEREGQRTQAQAVMQQTLAATAAHLPPAAAAPYNALAEQIDQGLTEQQRKETHFTAYRKRQSRS